MKNGRALRIALAIVFVSVLQTHGNASSAGLAEIGKAFPSLPQTTISLVLTTVSLAIVPAMLAAGALVRRISEKKLILIGFSMILVFGLASFFIRSFPLLIAARLLTGFGTGLTVPFQTSLIPQHFTGYEAQRLFGLQSATVSLLGIVFSLAGGILARISWEYGFLVYLMTIPALLVVAMWLPDKRSVERPADQPEQPFRMDRSLVYLVGMMFCFGIFVFQFVAGVAFLMNEKGVGDAGTAGVALAMFSGGAFASSLLYGRIQKAIGFYAVPLLMAFASAGLLAVGVGAGMGAPVAVYLLGGILVGSSLGAVMPSVASRVTELYAHSNPGMGIALVMGAFFLATLLSPFIMGQAAILPGGGTEEGRFLYAAGGMILLSLVISVTWKHFIPVNPDVPDMTLEKEGA